MRSFLTGRTNSVAVCDFEGLLESVSNTVEVADTLAEMLEVLDCVDETEEETLGVPYIHWLPTQSKL